MRIINKVMVHVDGTENSTTAAQYAIALCAATGAALTAIYVVNTHALRDLLRARIFIESESDEYQRDMDSDADRYLNLVSEMAGGKGVSVELVKSSGSVHQEIKREIAARGIDLLVIGELSRRCSRKDEFYEESERAMRSAPCSVLIVKDDDRVWEVFERTV